MTPTTRDARRPAVSEVADRYAARITGALDTDTVKPAVGTYIRDLRAIAGEHVSDADALDLLTYHAMTRPVFDALFHRYPFVAHDPVSRALAGPLDALDSAGVLRLGPDEQPLADLYRSARDQAAAVRDHAARQPLITALYEQFFRTALPRVASRLGIVFTPLEVVDYMLRSTDRAVRASHGRGLTDEGVQLIDPFSGTGVYFARLIQSDLIRPDDLARKYRFEMHGHEVVPLSWYVATINIEVAYAERTHRYLPFRGLALVDTFVDDLPCCDMESA